MSIEATTLLIVVGVALAFLSVQRGIVALVGPVEVSTRVLLYVLFVAGGYFVSEAEAFGMFP